MCSYYYTTSRALNHRTFGLVHCLQHIAHQPTRIQINPTHERARAQPTKFSPGVPSSSSFAAPRSTALYFAVAGLCFCGSCPFLFYTVNYKAETRKRAAAARSEGASVPARPGSVPRNVGTCPRFAPLLAFVAGRGAFLRHVRLVGERPHTGSSPGKRLS